jgi:hypothetical protein
METAVCAFWCGLVHATARAGKRFFSQREMNHDWNGSSEVEKRGQPDVDQDGNGEP